MRSDMGVALIRGLGVIVEEREVSLEEDGG